MKYFISLLSVLLIILTLFILNPQLDKQQNSSLIETIESRWDISIQENYTIIEQYQPEVSFTGDGLRYVHVNYAKDVFKSSLEFKNIRDEDIDQIKDHLKDIHINNDRLNQIISDCIIYYQSKDLSDDLYILYNYKSKDLIIIESLM